MLAVFMVDNIDDAVENTPAAIGTLRQAIFDANFDDIPDEIVFNSNVFNTPQIITLTEGELSITESLTITGTGRDNLTINGNEQDRIFSIIDSSGPSISIDVTLQGLKLWQGRAAGHGGAIKSIGASLTLLDSWVEDNWAGTDDGSGRGGGVHIEVHENNQILIQNTTIENNFALVGGGLDLFTLGGIEGASVQVIDSTIRQNTSTPFHDLLDDFVYVPELTSTHGGNGGGAGGGIYLTVPSTGNPGGENLYLISGSTISDNTAYSHGGGLSVEHYGDGELQILNSTFSGNQAATDGGGVSVLHVAAQPSAAATRIAHSTITDNEVGFDMTTGGLRLGVTAAKGGGLSVVGNTLNGATPTKLDHTIIAGNRDLWDDNLNPRDANSPDIHIQSGVSINGDWSVQHIEAPHSLLGVVTDGNDSAASLNLNPNFPGVSTAIVDGAGTIVIGTVSVGLAALADNGGLTETHLPLAGSQAIDAGNPFFDKNDPDGDPLTDDAILYDQRGAPFDRVFGVIDIGAVEVQVIDTPHVANVIFERVGTGGVEASLDMDAQDRDGSGDQIKNIGVVDVNTITVVFDTPINSPQLNDLSLVALHSETWTGDAPDPSTVLLAANGLSATWTLDDDIGSNQYILVLRDSVTSLSSGTALDGEWVNPFSTSVPQGGSDTFAPGGGGGVGSGGDGTAGGDFRFIFTFLAADFNTDNIVDLLDLDILGTNFGDSGVDFGQGDADNSGIVDLLDLDSLGTLFGADWQFLTSLAMHQVADRDDNGVVDAGDEADFLADFGLQVWTDLDNDGDWDTVDQDLFAVLMGLA